MQVDLKQVVGEEDDERVAVEQLVATNDRELGKDAFETGHTSGLKDDQVVSYFHEVGKYELLSQIEAFKFDVEDAHVSEYDTAIGDLAETGPTGQALNGHRWTDDEAILKKKEAEFLLTGN